MGQFGSSANWLGNRYFVGLASDLWFVDDLVDFVPSAEKLDVACDDVRQFAFASLPVSELPRLEPAFDIERLALLDVFRGDLGQAAETDHRVVLRLLACL